MTFDFVSLSSSPGRTGTFFYSEAFRIYNFPGVYSAKYCESSDEFNEVIQSGKYQGISVSMPFKQLALSKAHMLDESAKFAQSSNTLVLESKGYRAFSSDYYAALWIVDNFVHGEVSLLGNGAMGILFSKLLESKSIKYSVYSRSIGNWHLRHKMTDTLINCTSVGTNSIGSPVESVSSNSTVIDLAIKPTLLSRIAAESGCTYVAGIDFYTRVFRKQLEYYTKIVMSESEIESIRAAWVGQHA